MEEPIESVKSRLQSIKESAKKRLEAIKESELETLDREESISQFPFTEEQVREMAQTARSAIHSKYGEIKL